MTLFWAIAFDDALKAELGSALKPARERHPGRWVEPEKLHLTLLYLGQTERSVVSLVAAARGAAVRHRPFSLELRGAGTFGPERSPRVLWLGMAGDVGAAERLERDLRDVLAVKTERERFTGHVTVARPKGRGEALVRAATDLSQLKSAPFRAEQLTLFESKGGKYLVVGTVPLGEPLFHLVARGEWEAARAAGELRPASLTAHGFVHLSGRSQVLATASRFFAGRTDLRVLRIDGTKLTAPVKFEEGEPGELFPHLYGPLPVAAVTAEAALAADSAGRFSALPAAVAAE